MSVVVRPRFGRPCFECGETVPKQRLDQLAVEANARGMPLLVSDRLCVGCAAKVKQEATVTRRPRR